MQSIPLYYTTFSPSCVKNASKIFVKRQRGAFQESPPLDSPKPFTPLGECEHSATEYWGQKYTGQVCGEKFERLCPVLHSAAYRKVPKTHRLHSKGRIFALRKSALWSEVLAGSQGASFKKPPEWSAGQSPATFSPRISSADCCSRNSQCASSGERRRAFPPRVPRLRRNLHEAVRKPRANGIPIPCGARGSAPTPPESPR